MPVSNSDDSHTPPPSPPPLVAGEAAPAASELPVVGTKRRNAIGDISATPAELPKLAPLPGIFVFPNMFQVIDHLPDCS